MTLFYLRGIFYVQEIYVHRAKQRLGKPFPDCVNLSQKTLAFLQECCIMIFARIV